MQPQQAPSLRCDELHLLTVQDGQALVLEALAYLEQPGSDISRIGFLHNPVPHSDRGFAPGSSAAVVLHAALQLPSRRAKIPGFVRAFLKQTAPSSMTGEMNRRPFVFCYVR